MTGCYFSNNNQQHAWSLLEDLERIGYSNDEPRTVHSAQKEMMRFYQRQHDLDKAEILRKSIDVATVIEIKKNYCFFPDELEADDITDIRQELLQGKLELCRQRLETAKNNTHKLRRYRLWKLEIMHALLLHSEQNYSEATKVILGLLRHTNAQKLKRSFLDEGKPMQKLLLHVQKKIKQPDLKNRIDELCSRFPESGEQPIPNNEVVDLLPEPLTKRELSLLALAADGLSNKGIADKLCLSESTVKWHLSNSYAKLSVNKRTHAIVAARQLGLIE
ncbi:MAG: hypothetical protein CL693_07095 [Cellvibrionaceae bacterium]|nr:hypothetical protein [Cellvibrionaceae bacterium]|tara:strand:- start:5326 stop:6153 length:828 start_codon:yes stop_codon:yes gene_type:complete